jgi:hypothetical protein
MPFSNETFKKEIRDYLINNFDKEISILDVGPGIGTYFDLLSDNFKNMDACEIYNQYIIEYNLESKYRKVFNENILNLNFEYYDVIIMGDVFEHISENDCVSFINKIKNKCKQVIIQVPYDLEQGAWGGNLYETHLQLLNPEKMSKVYPMLNEMWANYPGTDNSWHGGVYNFK